VLTANKFKVDRRLKHLNNDNSKWTSIPISCLSLLYVLYGCKHVGAS